jgi:hypothetical protein
MVSIFDDDHLGPISGTMILKRTYSGPFTDSDGIVYFELRNQADFSVNGSWFSESELVSWPASGPFAFPEFDLNHLFIGTNINNSWNTKLVLDNFRLEVTNSGIVPEPSSILLLAPGLLLLPWCKRRQRLKWR